jgi:hypothetical protein
MAGVDHIDLVVSHLERSLPIYRELPMTNGSPPTTHPL